MNDTIKHLGPANTYLLITAYGLFGGFGVLGNLCITWVIATSNKHRGQFSSIFVMNLAITDFLVCILSIPYQIYSLATDRSETVAHQPYTSKYNGLCKLPMFTNFCTVFLRILSLTVMSIDRYIAINHPYLYTKYANHDAFKPMYAVGYVWLQAITSTIPAMFNNKWIIHFGSNARLCGIDWKKGNTAYTIIAMTLNFILPAVLIVFTNCKVFYIARQQAIKRRKRSSRFNNKQHPARGHYASKFRGWFDFRGDDLSRSNRYSTNYGSPGTNGAVQLASCPGNSVVNEPEAQVTIPGNPVVNEVGSLATIPGTPVSHEALSTSNISVRSVLHKPVSTSSIHVHPVLHEAVNTSNASVQPVTFPGNLGTENIHATVHDDSSIENKTVNISQGPVTTKDKANSREGSISSVGQNRTARSNIATQCQLHDVLHDVPTKEQDSGITHDIPNAVLKFEINSNSLAPEKGYENNAYEGDTHISTAESNKKTDLDCTAGTGRASKNTAHKKQHQFQKSSREWEIALSTIYLVVSYAISYMPFIISRLMVVFTSGELSIVVIAYTTIIPIFDSAVSPFIILKTRKEFQALLKRKVCC